MASVSAARVDCDSSQAAIADSPPIGEGAGVQHGTFKRPLLLETRSQAKYLSDISGDGVERSVGAAAKAGYLRGRRIQQQRAHSVRIQAIDLAAIARA